MVFILYLEYNKIIKTYMFVWIFVKAAIKSKQYLCKLRNKLEIKNCRIIFSIILLIKILIKGALPLK